MARRCRSVIAFCLITSSFIPICSALAGETVNYKYDPLGQLVQVARSGSVNNGVNACYSYDNASNRSNVTVATSDCAPALPGFSVNDTSATEGSPLAFTVTRSGSTSGSYSVNYATSNGTAAAGSDYAATSGTLAFASGETSKIVSVSTIDDSADELAETVTLTLSSPTGGATISDPTGVGTINDNDDTPPSFSIADTSVTEGGNLAFTVTKIGTVSSSYTVYFGVSGGTATAATDYTGTYSGSLVFGAAETTKTITFATIDDTTVENNETVIVDLTSTTGGATISDGQGVGTINNNDTGPPTFSISDASGVEGGSLVFTVTKGGSTGSTLSVNYATANGTATSTSDYVAASGTLSFAPSETSKTITVSTRNNSTLEATENFYVNLSGATGGAIISDSQGVGTIEDDDEGCPTC